MAGWPNARRNPLTNRALTRLTRRLKDISDKLKNASHGGASSSLNSTFNSIKSIPVLECIVSHSHIALLLKVSDHLSNTFPRSPSIYWQSAAHNWPQTYAFAANPLTRTLFSILPNPPTAGRSNMSRGLRADSGAPGSRLFRRLCRTEQKQRKQ